MAQPRRAELLECTLRDGSYAIDYRFTAKDTAELCAALERAGCTRIEIGHGVGLGGSSAKYGLAAATDEEYIAAAAGALRSAQFGAFFIPGIGTKEDLKRARSLGMGFIRVGTNITDTEKAHGFIEYAKELGFDVSYNAMKSYAVTADEFGDRVAPLVKRGADVLYVVDSAGCMLPDEVRDYVRAVRMRTDAPVGFHGHNNLMLANANCLAAFEEGAVFIDGTLQGMGRSGGNAQTESLAHIFQRRGELMSLDLFALLDLGEQLIRPRMAHGGTTSLEVAIGAGGFHSSFMDRVDSVVARIPVDRKRLLIELGKRERINPTVAIIELVASEIAKESSGR